MKLLLSIMIISSFAYAHVVSDYEDEQAHAPQYFHYADPRPLMSEDPINPPVVDEDGNNEFGIDYEECAISSNWTPIEPSNTLPGYKCYPARNADLIDSASAEIPGVELDNLTIQLLRKNLFGMLDSSEQIKGRGPGALCYHPTSSDDETSVIFQVYDEETQHSMPGTSVSKQLATPRIPGFISSSEKNQFLSLGCTSNRCGVKPGVAYNSAAPYAHYECKPRFLYRCLSAGESASNDNECCGNLLRNAAGKCEMPIIEQESVLEGFPNHVEPTTGLIKFSDDPEERKIANGKIAASIIAIRSLEFFFDQQNTSSTRAVPDNIIMRKIGNKLKSDMKAALYQYNAALNELNELKDQFTTLSSQMNDPEEYFISQAEVNYGDRQFQSAEEFKQFVQNSTSGAEIFKLMAKEQEIQLRYEYAVISSINNIINGNGGDNLDYLESEWRARDPEKKKEDKIFKKTFEYKYKRKFKNRWKARYKIRSDGRTELFSKLSEFPKVRALNLENTVLLQQSYPGTPKSSAEILARHYYTFPQLNIHPKWIVEPYHIIGSDFADYGQGGDRRRRLKKKVHITKLFENYKLKFEEYMRTNYFTGSGELIDVTLGGTRACLTDNNFPVKETAQCLRYKNSLEMIRDDVMLNFFQVSTSEKQKYYGSTISKRRAYFEQKKTKMLEATEIYSHMSGLPDGLSLSEFVTPRNYQELFDKYNQNPSYPGYLRYKSYLFYMAKAKKIEQDMMADDGIDTGGSGYNPGTLYGSGNTVASVENGIEQTGNEVGNSINSSITSSLATSSNAGSITGRTGVNTSNGVSISGGNASTSAYKRNLAKLNKAAKGFAKKNPKLKSKLAKIKDARSKARNNAYSAIADRLNAGSSKSGSLSPSSGPGLSNLSKKSSKEEDRKKIDPSLFTQESNIAGNGLDSSSQGSYYKESRNGSRSNSNKNQLTGLSDYQLKQAIKNSKDQSHLYKSSEYDGIFERISKTYARSYSRFLIKKGDRNRVKVKGGSLKQYENDKAKVIKMLDGF